MARTYLNRCLCALCHHPVPDYAHPHRQIYHCGIPLKGLPMIFYRQLARQVGVCALSMAGQMGSQDRRRSWQPNFLRRCPSVALRARHEAHASPPDNIGVSSFSYNTPQERDTYSSKPIDEHDYYKLQGLRRCMYHASYLASYVYSSTTTT